MTRLFISLYLVITLGLLLINWSSEYIWQQLHTDSDPQVQRIETLALTISHNLSENNKPQLTKIIGAPIEILKPQDVQWLEWQRKLLDDRGVIISYDPDDRITAYVLDASQHQLIVLGPIALPQADSVMKNIILLLSTWYWRGLLSYG